MNGTSMNWFIDDEDVSKADVECRVEYQPTPLALQEEDPDIDMFPSLLRMKTSTVNNSDISIGIANLILNKPQFHAMRCANYKQHRQLLLKNHGGMPMAESKHSNNQPATGLNRISRSQRYPKANILPQTRKKEFIGIIPFKIPEEAPSSVQDDDILSAMAARNLRKRGSSIHDDKSMFSILLNKLGSNENIHVRRKQCGDTLQPGQSSLGWHHLGSNMSPAYSLSRSPSYEPRHCIDTIIDYEKELQNIPYLNQFVERQNKLSREGAQPTQNLSYRYSFFNKRSLAQQAKPVVTATNESTTQEYNSRPLLVLRKVSKADSANSSVFDLSTIGELDNVQSVHPTPTLKNKFRGRSMSSMIGISA